MVKAPMEVYRQTLAGYIHDEDKLVTYKWLSKELEVHVNTAKEILADYWDKHKNDEIVATVMIIGNTKDGGMRVEVVKESDLEEAFKKYDKIISQHLYSLQKTLPDLQSLVNTGKGDSKFAAIKCKECVVLSDEEVFLRRWGPSIQYQAPFDEKNQPPPPAIKIKEPVNPLKKAFANSKPADEKDQNKEKENPKESVKTEGKTEVKKISPPGKSGDKKGAIPKKPVQSTQKGFSALFGKVQNQKKSPPSTSNGIKPNDVTKTPPETNSKDKEECPMEVEVEIVEEISSKQSTEKKSSPIEHKSKQIVKNPFASCKSETKKSTAVETKKDQQKQKKSSPPEVKKSITNGSTKAEKSKKSSRGKKRERSQDSHNDSKKRKRIVVVSDSSEESEPEEELDPLGTSIREEPVTKQRSPSPPPVQRIEGKRKVRKMVDKHFVDEDGFMVTKKVQVMESCSEDEATPEPPKEKKPSPPKASAISKAKKNTKQSSITNFFTKS